MSGDFGLGGLLGALYRYGPSGLVHRGWRGPLAVGTLVMNVLGRLPIGVAMALVEERQLLSSSVRLFLLIGFFGPFTSFSTVSYETFALLRAGETRLAAANAAANVTRGVAAVVQAWIAVTAPPAKERTVKIEGEGQLLRILIGESGRWHSAPRYEAIVRRARELGLAGATVLRGSAAAFLRGVTGEARCSFATPAAAMKQGRRVPKEYRGLGRRVCVNAGRQTAPRRASRHRYGPYGCAYRCYGRLNDDKA